MHQRATWGVSVAAALVAVSCGRSAGPSPSEDDPPRAAPPAPSKPPPAPRTLTFGELLYGDGVRGRIAVDLVVLPELLIETDDNGSRHRYVVGVDAGSAYLARLGELADAADQLLPRARKLAKQTSNDRAFIATVEAIGALRTKVSDARSAIDDLIVIQIDNDTKIDADLQTVFQETAGIDMARYTNIDLQYLPVASYEEADAALAALEAQEPPDLAASMPDVHMLEVGIGYFSTADSVRRYNKLVARFNRELGRRRKLMARRTPLELAGLAAELRFLAARAPERFVGEVMEPEVLASRALDHDHAASGERAYLRDASDEPGWSARYFTRTALLFLSNPPGAVVWLDGQEKGKTPYLAADLPVGTSVQVKLMAPKHRTLEHTVDITAVPVRFRAITDVMTKAP